MPNAKLKLTKTAVEKVCLPPQEGETNSKGRPIDSLRYWDTELRGFGLEVYRSGRRTWFVQRDVVAKRMRAVNTLTQRRRRRLRANFRIRCNPAWRSP